MKLNVKPRDRKPGVHEPRLAFTSPYGKLNTGTVTWGSDKHRATLHQSLCSSVLCAGEPFSPSRFRPLDVQLIGDSDSLHSKLMFCWVFFSFYNSHHQRYLFTFCNGDIYMFVINLGQLKTLAFPKPLHAFWCQS